MMARLVASPIQELIRRLVEDGRVRELPDQELLQRFHAHQDQLSFHCLVRRHGAMVLDVCREVLGNEADAEDAFQATFLILARKAGSIRKAASVGSWLYGVAHRTALKARAESATRQKHEARVPKAHASEPDDLSWREVRQVLHEEVGRLPERYRAPLILCYLEGATQDSAAVQLNLAKSTLRERLERGRELLRLRLTRRGLGPAALLVGVAWPAASASAKVPLSVMAATVQAASLLAMGRAPAPEVVSFEVVSLAEGVLKNMLLARLKVVTAVLLMLPFLFGLGTGLIQQPVDAQDQREAVQESRTPADSSRSGSALAADGVKAADPDTDGDGLSDFQEIHKYRSDPMKMDTAGKGVPDGDWNQRREFTYSVRAVVRVMPPYNLAALNDDYQDVRVRKETKQFVELEAVLYPLNSNADAIRGNPNWKKDYAGMKEFLAPGITTNWDEPMRQELLRELAKDGIDPDKLTDKEVVERVSRWLFQRSRYRNMFCTFYTGFRDGKPVVLPGLEKAFERDRGDPKWDVQQQFEHELYGKQMFASRTHGTCTSTAVYQTTVLRALGIPTRMILCIPLADASDPAQVELIEKGLTNHQVRQTACLGVLSAGSSFASHTFCEVFVGGRWRRLNSSTLGQNILDRSCLGLMIHVHTFKDLSDANLAATWGTRYAKGQRDDVFAHSNPYRLMEVSDHFGKFAKVANPGGDKELKLVTIGKAYWPEGKDAPKEIRDLKWWKDPRSGQFFVHCEEWLEDAGDYLQYRLFMRRTDRQLVLRAKGQPDVACEITMNFYTYRTRNLCELEVIIPPAEYARMAKGVAYTLHPVNGKKGYQWKVRDGLTVKRE
jgi:RNA polymerase sigma factor (sigma-70 family)